jgi:hypothetical protein
LSFHHTFKQEKLSLSYLEVAEQLIRNLESAGQVPILKKKQREESGAEVQALLLVEKSEDQTFPPTSCRGFLPVFGGHFRRRTYGRQQQSSLEVTDKTELL